MKTNEKSAESLHETNANLKSTIRDIMNLKKILIKSGIVNIKVIEGALHDALNGYTSLKGERQGEIAKSSTK